MVSLLFANILKLHGGFHILWAAISLNCSFSEKDAHICNFPLERLII